MNTRCFFGIHDWGVIPCPLTGLPDNLSTREWTNIPKSFKPKGEQIFMLHRVCKGCGKRQW